jgi:hypothetical protein
MPDACCSAERPRGQAITSARGDKKPKPEDLEPCMTRKLTAAVLLALSLAGTTAASAQTARDYYRYQWTGRGQCTTDEGYGRFGTCDGGSGN